MKQYNKFSNGLLNKLQLVFDKKFIFTDKGVLENYSHDETENLSFPPEVLLKPGSTEEVSTIMKFAYENNIHVTPIGARTGLSGGALSIHGGIGLSMKRFNKVISIDEDNLQRIVEPGDITLE